VTDSSGRVQILLVEDEPLNRELVQAMLHRATHPMLKDAQVIEADSVALARTKIAETAFDIVLLDVQLPDGSGLTIAEEINAGPPGRRPSIIALTAGVLPEQHAAAVKAGCDTILGKPHTSAELIAALTAHLPATGAQNLP
jgi:two-component system KDP operon response regulator KdpE